MLQEIAPQDGDAISHEDAKMRKAYITCFGFFAPSRLRVNDA
ncbi:MULTISPECIES: hypothetical protein [unclassified Methanoculleus]|nr:MULTISPECIES: hypothetical protein [unclassified Methanoculleus]